MFTIACSIDPRTSPTASVLFVFREMRPADELAVLSATIPVTPTATATRTATATAKAILMLTLISVNDLRWNADLALRLGTGLALRLPGILPMVVSPSVGGSARQCGLRSP
jgi:hypothetical protein